MVAMAAMAETAYRARMKKLKAELFPQKAAEEAEYALGVKKEKAARKAAEGAEYALGEKLGHGAFGRAPPFRHLAGRALRGSRLVAIPLCAIKTERNS